MGHKILLADDSITIQKVIELTFSDEDFELHTVGNGQKAMDEIRSIQPDIVLCDIIMPEKNGYEVCEFIKYLIFIPKNSTAIIYPYCCTYLSKLCFHYFCQRLRCNSPCLFFAISLQ